MKKKCLLVVLIVMFIISHTTAYAETTNQTDTDLCDTLKYAFINSLKEPIDEAIKEIYKDDTFATNEGLSWAPFQTEITEINQIYGVGGEYEITLKIYPYYRAHNTYGEDLVVVNTDGELISYEHVKTFPIIGENLD
ncbi:DUF3888 domain-containing protein [Oceanobacillus iheyensis]|uniref:DUF3888 domain-containing protein n=1 Tax=Oceanobacillus iheyensis TaxID=182710 RepID=UPI0036311576